MSVKTSVSSTAQSLSTCPGMLSGPGALRALILLRDLFSHCLGTASSPGRGRRWSLLCSGAVLCLKASEEGIQLVQQGDGTVTGLWWGLVARNGLNPLPQALSVSAVTETMGYPPGVLSLSLSDAA